MLERNLTMYQLLGKLEQMEYLQRIINLLNTSAHACGAIDYVLNQEETFCKDKHIKLPLVHPHEENQNRG